MTTLRSILVILLITCSTLAAREVNLTILHTTDLHGHIWPTQTYEGQTNVGGFLRCAARIEQIRAEEPNHLLIDCGDTFQGAPESFKTDGRLLIEGLNRLDYDAWVLGNHEFDWGTRLLRARHDQVEVPFLAANLYFNRPENNWLPNIKPFVIREVDGIRIAIVGLVTPGIPRWSRPHLLDGAMFRQSVESLAEILPAVKAETPDVLVVVVHQGYRNRGDDFANQIQAIAKSFPEIDVLLGGHTHTPVEDMRIGPVLFSQAGYYGIWLGRLTLTYDTVKKSVVEKRGVLELMDAAVPYHTELLTLWSNDLARIDQELSLPLGATDVTLSPVPDAYGVSSMQQMICRAIAEGTGAELVLHGSLADDVVTPGELKLRDVWRMVPYENTIGIVSLTPQEIREVLEENFSRKVGSQSLGPYGFTFRMERDGSRVVVSDLRDVKGEPLHPRKRYRVAMNSYVLASGGERYLSARRLADQPESRLEMLDDDTRDMVTRYLKKHNPLTAEHLDVAAVP